MIKHQRIHPKIERCLEGMVSDLSDVYGITFFGEFMNFVNIIEKKGMGTAGVNTTLQGMNMYYDPKFFDLLTDKEVNFVVTHEIFHLLYNHQSRTRQGGFDPEMANICQDMIINNTIIEDMNKEFVSIPTIKEGKEKGKEACLRIPTKYTGKHVFEFLYDYMDSQLEKYIKEQKANTPDKDDQQGDGDGEGNGKGDGEGNGKGNGQSLGERLRGRNRPDKDGNYPNGNQSKIPGDERNIFDQYEDGKPLTLDEHMLDEVPEELKKEMVDDVVRGLRARGVVGADIEGILGKLQKKRKDHLKIIKQQIGSLKGLKKNRSFSKLNRKGFDYLKGIKKYGTKINVILDNSGSMYGFLEKVMNYIFQDDTEVNLIIADTEVKDVYICKNKKDIQNVIPKGYGGTCMQPAIDFIAGHKTFKKYSLLLLSDGFTDTLNFDGIKKKCLIISCGEAAPLQSGSKNVKQIIIEE